MQFLLKASGNNENKATLEIGDAILENGTLEVSTDSWPACEGIGDSVYITREEAAAVVAHLTMIFGLAHNI